ncbi:MAG: hypothetical protein O4806_06620 [Trichodesmium sp. St5_bin8]|nr:hypothetical protein [Trichodesmium sp. St5_bin8]
MTHYLSEKRLQEIIFLGFTKYLLQTFPNFSTLIKLVSVGVRKYFAQYIYLSLMG